MCNVWEKFKAKVKNLGMFKKFVGGVALTVLFAFRRVFRASFWFDNDNFHIRKMFVIELGRGVKEKIETNLFCFFCSNLLS